jgi:hypothetical protein
VLAESTSSVLDFGRQYYLECNFGKEMEAEERRHQIEAERAERERLRQFEQARIGRFLRDAAAFRQANQIRKYVAANRLLRG